MTDTKILHWRGPKRRTSWAWTSYCLAVECVLRERFWDNLWIVTKVDFWLIAVTERNEDKPEINEQQRPNREDSLACVHNLKRQVNVKGYGTSFRAVSPHRKSPV